MLLVRIAFTQFSLLHIRLLYLVQGAKCLGPLTFFYFRVKTKKQQQSLKLKIQNFFIIMVIKVEMTFTSSTSLQGSCSCFFNIFLIKCAVPHQIKKKTMVNGETWALVRFVKG